jgi:hypothetical protein
VRRAKGKALQRRRSEVCERSFAHVCEAGGARRTWLWGLTDVSKRHQIAAAAHNLGRLLLRLTGSGKPKAPRGEADLAPVAQLLVARLRTAAKRLWAASAGARNWFRPRPAA